MPVTIRYLLFAVLFCTVGIVVFQNQDQWSAAPTAAQEREGESFGTLVANNDAEIYLKESREFIFSPLKKSQALKFRDTIFVGPNSKATLELSDELGGGALTLSENTVLTLTRLGTTDAPVLEVKQGAIQITRPTEDASKKISAKNAVKKKKAKPLVLAVGDRAIVVAESKETLKIDMGTSGAESAKIMRVSEDPKQADAPVEDLVVLDLAKLEAVEKVEDIPVPAIEEPVKLAEREVAAEAVADPEVLAALAEAEAKAKAEVEAALAYVPPPPPPPKPRALTVQEVERQPAALLAQSEADSNPPDMSKKLRNELVMKSASRKALRATGSTGSGLDMVFQAIRSFDLFESLKAVFSVEASPKGHLAARAELRYRVPFGTAVQTHLAGGYGYLNGSEKDASAGYRKVRGPLVGLDLVVALGASKFIASPRLSYIAPAFTFFDANNYLFDLTLMYQFPRQRYFGSFDFEPGLGFYYSSLKIDTVLGPEAFSQMGFGLSTTF